MSEELEQLVLQFAVVGVAAWILYQAFGGKLPFKTKSTDVAGSGTAPLLYNQSYV